MLTCGLCEVAVHYSVISTGYWFAAVKPGESSYSDQCLVCDGDYYSIILSWVFVSFCFVWILIVGTNIMYI